MGYPSPETCYIMSADGKVVVNFQLAAQQIQDTKSVTYHNIPIIGRSSPYKTYYGSNARVLSFVLHFFAHPNGQGDNNDMFMVANTLKALKSLTYPDYSGFVIKPPKKVLVSIGAMIQLEAVCTNCSITYPDPAPWDLAVSICHAGSAAMVFEECQDDPSDYLDTDFVAPTGSLVTGGKFG